MKLLITGGAGYIGSHTVNALLKQGHQLVVIDDLSTGFKESLNTDKVQLYQANILDLQALEAIFSSHTFDGIIHFAAKIIVSESVEKPLMYYENNVIGAYNLLQMCQKYRVNRFVFSSTAAVYGQNNKAHVHEDDVVQPINPYGETKFVVERMLKYFSVSNPDFKYVVLRYFNVAGADLESKNGQRTKNATHLVKVACEAALGLRSEVQVYGTDYPTKDGTGVRDYIHILDLVSAHCMALDYLSVKGISSEIINCGYGQGFSVLEVIEAIRRISKSNFKVNLGDRRPGDPASVVAHNQKILKLFGWKPQHDSIDEICGSSFEWEKLKTQTQ